MKPEVLCASCNNEWGSNLEQRVAHILGPMADGEPKRLDRQQQQLVAAWFYLKVMVAEHLIPLERRSRRFFELEHGQRLKAMRCPPGNTTVWLGDYVGDRSNAGWVIDRGAARQISDDPPAGVLWHSVTYSIGRVLLHAFAMSRAALLSPELNPKEYGPLPVFFPVADADWGSALTQIWEPKHRLVDWPPTKAFDDGGFVYLAERWLQEKSDNGQ